MRPLIAVKTFNIEHTLFASSGSVREPARRLEADGGREAHGHGEAEGAQRERGQGEEVKEERGMSW